MKNIIKILSQFDSNKTSFTTDTSISDKDESVLELKSVRNKGYYQQGGEVKFEKKNISVNGKSIMTEIATTPEQLKQGLKHRTEITPMLLKFEKKGDKSITMKDVGNPLKLAFINKNKVTSIVKRNIVDSNKLTTRPADAVLELPIGFNIKNGDKVIYQDGGTLSVANILSQFKPNTMYLLDEKGKVQKELKGNERIFSRIHTKELVDLAKQANTKEELLKLGGTIAKILDKHDTQKPQYVNE